MKWTTRKADWVCGQVLSGWNRCKTAEPRCETSCKPLFAQSYVSCPLVPWYQACELMYWQPVYFRRYEYSPCHLFQVQSATWQSASGFVVAERMAWGRGASRTHLSTGFTHQSQFIHTWYCCAFLSWMESQFFWGLVYITTPAVLKYNYLAAEHPSIPTC